MIHLLIILIDLHAVSKGFSAAGMRINLFKFNKKQVNKTYLIDLIADAFVICNIFCLNCCMGYFTKC